MEKGVAAGLILAVVCGGLLGYGIIYMFPITNGVVQTKFSTWNTIAAIDESYNSSVIGVLDTYLSITTRGSSYLVIRFTSMYIHYLNTGHDGISRYEINLTLNGQTLRSGLINWDTEAALTSQIEISGSLTLEYVTNPLPAGTYTVNMTWISKYSIGSTDSLLVLTSPVFNYTRSLFIQEIAL